MLSGRSIVVLAKEQTSCNLAEEEAHVWHLAADNEGDARAYDRWWELLSHDERGRASRFVLPADRHRFVVAHAALRLILSRYTCSAPTLLGFATNAYGRPELTTTSAGRPLRFNLSHTHGLVAVAVCRAYDIGIDVECMSGRAIANLLDLAARFFSPLETAALRGLPNDQRDRRFLQVWTLKEAYIKARGLGLSIPLHAFSFDLADDSIPAIRIDPSLGDDAHAWRFVAMQPTPRHWLAVAVRAHHHNPRVVVRAIAPSDLE
jgi:4'-phosphopantetheinyl transferase